MSSDFSSHRSLLSALNNPIPAKKLSSPPTAAKRSFHRTKDGPEKHVKSCVGW
jgi:hypothetical protein